MTQYGSPACVLIIDLDELKEVNDTLGHDKGDELIRLAGEALRSAVRETDVVARLGGDEFGIIACDCNVDSAEALEARVRDALRDNQVKASVGMATRDPRSGLDAAVAEADRRMYEEKSGNP